MSGSVHPSDARRNAGLPWSGPLAGCPYRRAGGYPAAATVSACGARTGATSTGMPLSTALPETGVDAAPRRRARWSSTPAWARGDAEAATPSTSWPQPCGMRDDAGHDRRRSPRPAPRPRRRASARGARSPSLRPSRAASSGCTCSVQRSGPSRAAARLCIHELFERRWRRPTSTMPAVARARPSAARSRGDVGDDRLAARARPCPLGVRSTSGSRGCSGPRSMPCGRPSRRAQSVERRSRRVGAGAQHAGRAAARAGRGASVAEAARRRRGRASGECSSATSRPTSHATTKSSIAATSASGPWPGDERRSAAAASPTRRHPVGSRSSDRRRVVGARCARRAGRSARS